MEIPEQTHRHFIINKPWGYLSQFIYNQPTRKNRKLLGTLDDFPKGTMAIGRLDQNSEGLLLLTTDGKVSEQVRSKKVEKEYHVQLDGVITDEAIAQLTQGLEITLQHGKYTTLPCKSERIEPAPVYPGGTTKIRSDNHGPISWLSVTLSEGKYRQVRKMTAAVGFPTLRLVRVRIGNIHLDNLLPGEVIEVEKFEL